MQHELLAPAGDFNCLRAALDYGADAIYIGGPGLQLRSDKVGFDREGLVRAVNLVHARGKRLYVTVNSFAENSDIAYAGDYGAWLYSIGVDAAIISDLGVLAAVKAAAPELEAHISTQANCTNYKAAEVYYNLGAKRVVLARELSLEAIRELRAKAPAGLDLECFVHGAMCMSYSGRCLISSYLTGRSGNRGACTQPCRWDYYLMEETRPGEYFPVTEDEKGAAILSSHDLNCIDLLPELDGAGVLSYKLEGRMKTAYYVATVVNAYRRALDGTADPDYCRRELNAVTHRPYNTGFYYGNVKNNNYNHGKYIQDCTFVANVLGWHDGTLTLRQRNRFAVGDTLEVVEPGTYGRAFTVERIEDTDGLSMTAAPHPMQEIKVNCPFKIAEGAFLRRREGERLDG